MREPRSLAVALVVGAVILLVAPVVPVNGDAVVYAHQADTGALAERWTHAGYVMLLMMFRGLMGPVGGDVLTAVCAGWATAVVGRAHGSAAAAMVGGALLSLAPFAEVDAVWFALLAAGAHARSEVRGGALLAASIAVSPTALVALPWGVWARPGRRWRGMPWAVLALTVISAGGWWLARRGVLTGGWTPAPLAHLPWLVAGAVLAAPGWFSGEGAATHRAALPWVGLALLAPADVPSELVGLLALSPFVAIRSRRAVAAGAALALTVGIARAFVMSNQTLRESDSIRAVAEELEEHDGLVGAWSWVVRVSAARTGDPEGVPWLTSGGAHSDGFCERVPPTVVWLPPGGGPPGPVARVGGPSGAVRVPTGDPAIQEIIRRGCR